MIPRFLSASFLSVELKVAFNTRLKKKHLMEEGGKMSARLAKPQVSRFTVYVLLSVTTTFHKLIGSSFIRSSVNRKLKQQRGDG